MVSGYMVCLHCWKKMLNNSGVGGHSFFFCIEMSKTYKNVVDLFLLLMSQWSSNNKQWIKV